MPGRAEGRQKRRYEPDHERVACPCSRCVESGGEPVTKRTMRRHLSEEPIKRGPDDLDPGGDVDPESQVGDDQAGVEQPSMWSDPTLASPFLASAGPMTFGAIITLMLALQLRFHLTGLSMVTVYFCITRTAAVDEDATAVQGVVYPTCSICAPVSERRVRRVCQRA